jgi:RsiW-degrading membrane proteinase PrsW (M82 family)
MADQVSLLQLISILFISGIMPTFLWLFFWLREDRFKPEPRGLLALTFIGGALAVFLILPLEKVALELGILGIEKIFFFAAAEEIAKLLVVFLISFNSSYLDEPIDYAIYLITGALGFAATENVLFLLAPSLQNNTSFIIETGTLRFLGATILHSVLAAVLGIIIGFVFYKKRSVRFLYSIMGLIIVIILHTLFNYFIIRYVELNGLLILGVLWLVTLIIIGLLERVRRINH